MENDYLIFLYNVVWLRKRYGISKKNMAKLMGIGVESLNKMESGVFPNRLKVNAILNTSRYFRIKPATLLSKQLDEAIMDGRQIAAPTVTDAGK